MDNYSRLKEFREFVLFPTFVFFVYISFVCSSSDEITIQPALILTWNFFLKATPLAERASDMVFFLERTSSILLCLYLFYVFLSLISFFWGLLCWGAIYIAKENEEYDAKVGVESYHLFTAFHYIKELRVSKLLFILIISVALYAGIFLASCAVPILLIILLKIISLVFSSLNLEYFNTWAWIGLIFIHSTCSLYCGFTAYPKKELVGSG
jgi:hypothetical protein